MIWQVALRIHAAPPTPVCAPSTQTLRGWTAGGGGAVAEPAAAAGCVGRTARVLDTLAVRLPTPEAPADERGRLRGAAPPRAASRMGDPAISLGCMLLRKDPATTTAFG